MIRIKREKGKNNDEIVKKKICLNVELSLSRDLRIHQDVVPNNGDICVSKVVEEREV